MTYTGEKPEHEPDLTQKPSGAYISSDPRKFVGLATEEAMKRRTIPLHLLVKQLQSGAIMTEMPDGSYEVAYLGKGEG